ARHSADVEKNVNDELEQSSHGHFRRVALDWAAQRGSADWRAAHRSSSRRDDSLPRKRRRLLCGSINVPGRLVMNEKKSSPIKRRVQTDSGRISYTEQGAGPVALFVHGVLLNGYLWRNQLADLSDIRRCIAVDLLAHGDTEITLNQDVSVTANAKMLKAFLDAL